MLSRLERGLAQGTWRHGNFDLLELRDPKPRVIARASIEDRVVHTALVEAMLPALERTLTRDAFACRPGLGTHRALLRLLELLRRQRFALHLDVASYFPSVHLGILRGLLERRIADDAFLAVLDRVLEAGRGLYDAPRARRHARMGPDWPPPGRGLPIGAYTSQVLAAHLYLDGLDHFVKRELKVPGYVRYVDDLFLFGDRRADLRAWRAEVAGYLARERDLRLKRPGAPVLSCRGHLDALGHRVERAGIAPRRRALRRLAATAARESRRRWPREGGLDVIRSVAGSIGGMLEV